MLRGPILVAGILMALPALGQEQPLSGARIAQLLAGQTAVTPRDPVDIEQVFYPSGRTLYDDGRPSWGYWRVTGDQYCSQWPPQEAWTCYDMWAFRRDGRQWVVWVGESGTRYEARLGE